MPFFLFLPIVNLHFPTLPHPDFDGASGYGGSADQSDDKLIDDIDQSAFMFDDHDRSLREGFPFYIKNTLYAMKWRDRKLHFIENLKLIRNMENWKARLFSIVSVTRKKNTMCWSPTLG